MFVDVHAFWLARKLSTHLPWMNTKEVSLYSYIYLWKQNTGEWKGMAGFDSAKECDEKFAKMRSMDDGPEYDEARAAFVAWMPHNIASFERDMNMESSMIVSLGLRKLTTKSMTHAERTKINARKQKQLDAAERKKIRREKAALKIQSSWRKRKTNTGRAQVPRLTRT